MLENPIFVLFLVAGLGSLLGALPLGRARLNVLGVLLAGLAAGLFGLNLPAFVLSLGLVLFVYAVGLRSGPSFFEAFRRDGVRLLGLSVAVTAASATATAGVAALMGVDRMEILGLVCGTFNSPLALAAVQERIPSSGPSVAFGLVFPLALLGMVLAVRLTPRLLGAHSSQALKEHDEKQKRLHPSIESGYFKVTNPACDGHPLSDLHISDMTGAVLATVERGKRVLPATGRQVLHLGDTVKAVGTKDALERCRVAIGERVRKRRTKARDVVIRRVMVTNRQVVGKSLGDLALEERFDSVVTRIVRGGVQLAPRASTTLYYGDRLVVVVRQESAADLIAFLGDDIQGFQRAELAPAFVAMAAGAALGFVPLPLPGGLTLRLGMAGGVLTLGLVLGRLGKVGPFIFTMPVEASLVLRRLGSALLMASVGVLAGRGLDLETIRRASLLVVPMAAGLAAATTVGLFVARKALRADTVETVGYLAGALGNTPAMESGCSALGTEAPAEFYALVYPISLVLQLVAAQVLLAVL